MVPEARDGLFYFRRQLPPSQAEDRRCLTGNASNWMLASWDSEEGREEDAILKGVQMGQGHPVEEGGSISCF